MKKIVKILGCPAITGLIVFAAGCSESKTAGNDEFIEFPVEPETPGVYSFIFHFNMPEIQLETTFEYEFQ